MQIIDDVISSVSGSLKTRVKDPFLGTFIVTWCLCNWDKIALLFWGNDKVEARISNLVNSLSVIEDSQLFIEDLSLIILPFTLTLIYLFAWPWLSFMVNWLQHKIVLKRHQYTTNLEVNKLKNQMTLNKAALLADPNKDFLGNEIQLEQNEKKNKQARRHKIIKYIEKKTAERNAKSLKEITLAEKEKVELEQKRIELEIKKRDEQTQKRNFQQQTAIHDATLASARFPALYQLMLTLSDSLKQDGIVMSINGLAECIASIFGYSNADKLMSDVNFTNSNLRVVKYIYHSYSKLTKDLALILDEEGSKNEDLTVDLLYEHLIMIFEELPIDFLSEESLSEKISLDVQENSCEILSRDELSEPIAMSDAIYDEIDLETQRVSFTDDFKVNIGGVAYGPHRTEYDISGRPLHIQIEAICKPVVGRFGLSNYELNVKGELRY